VNKIKIFLVTKYIKLALLLIFRTLENLKSEKLKQVENSGSSQGLGARL